MFLNENKIKKIPQIDTPFLTTTESFRYLGIRVTPDLNNMIPANYDPLVGQETGLLNRWSNLTLSMIRKINIIKMSILPKIVYYFHTLPFPLPDAYFDKLSTY